MTLTGWAFLILACGAITALVIFCYWRVLTSPEAEEEIHAPLDIDTGDLDRPVRRRD